MRVLFASTRGGGHVGPLVPLARTCLRAGHEVLLAAPASAPRFGLTHRAVAEPSREEVAAVWTPTWPPSPVPAARVIGDLFVGLYARAALPDMLNLVAEWRPDVVVRETMEFGSALAAERHDVPQVRFGIHLDARIDQASLEGELRVRPAGRTPAGANSSGRLAGMAAAALEDLRVDAGLEPDPSARALLDAPLLTLAPRAFGEVPGVRRFRDPDVRPRAPRDLVYVSFGSEAPHSELYPVLYRTAIADLPGQVLVTTGRDPAELGPVPANVRVERWVPQQDVMPHAAVMVGHGGSGSTLMALAAGVPQVLVPLFVDGPVNARRVAELSAGIALDGGPDADVAGAVKQVLEMPRYSWGAALLAAEIANLPPIDEAVALLEAQRSAAGQAIR
jgi:UDP-glucoronosyl and UDP-glucosyl transferase